jgi:hypothetical protein
VPPLLNQPPNQLQQKLLQRKPPLPNRPLNLLPRLPQNLPLKLLLQNQLPRLPLNQLPPNLLQKHQQKLLPNQP